MKWPWHRKDSRLTRAEREHAEVKSKTPHRKELARKAEQHLREDPFGEAFRRALGGSP